jgi:hypothetical protein
LRRAVPAVLVPDDPSEEENGVWAPPGQYRIELSVGGKSYRQLLTVAPDPRIKLSAAVYARQFALARGIEDARVRIATALAEAGHIHAAIADRGKASDGATTAALSAADQRLLAVSDIVPHKDPRDSIGAPPTKVSGLRYLGSAFKNLAAAIDGADAAPSPDALRSQTKLQALLEPTLKDWLRFKTEDLVRLNMQLQAKGMAPVAP